MSPERMLYFKDLQELSIVCYVRQEYDEFRDIVHNYDINIKGLAKLGQTFHYMLVRDKQETKKEKTMTEIMNIIKANVNIAISRLHCLADKALDDAVKLEVYLRKMERELKDGK